MSLRTDGRTWSRCRMYRKNSRITVYKATRGEHWSSWYNNPDLTICEAAGDNRGRRSPGAKSRSQQSYEGKLLVDAQNSWPYRTAGTKTDWCTDSFRCYNSSGVTTVAGVMHPKYQTRDPIVRRGDSGFNQPDAPLVWAWPKTTCNCRVSSLFKWTNPNEDTEKLLLTFWIIILDARWLLLRRDEGGEEGRGLLPRLIIKLQDVCECVCVCSGEQTHFHHIIQRVFSCVHLSSASAHWWQVLKSVDLRLDNQILSKKGKKMSFLTLCISYFLCGKNGQWKGTIVLLKLN